MWSYETGKVQEVTHRIVSFTSEGMEWRRDLVGDKPREKKRLPVISSAYVLGPRLHTSLCLHVSSLVKEYLKSGHQVR